VGGVGIRRGLGCGRVVFSGGLHVLCESVEGGGGLSDLDVGGELGDGDGKGLRGFALDLRGDDAVAVCREEFEGLDVGAGAGIVGERDDLVGGQPERGIEAAELIGGGEGVDELLVGGMGRGHRNLLYQWSEDGVGAHRAMEVLEWRTVGVHFFC